MYLLPGVLVASALILWAGLISLIYGVLRRSSPYIIAGIAGAVILVSLCVVGSVTIALGIKAMDFFDAYLAKRNSPEEVFSSYFGFAPTRDVTNIHVQRSADFGFEYALMAFVASAPTVERIVAARGLVQVPGSFSPYLDASLPTWWNPPVEGHALRYGGRFDDREYTRQTELLIYDESSGTAYYLFDGADEPP